MRFFIETRTMREVNVPQIRCTILSFSELNPKRASPIKELKNIVPVEAGLQLDEVFDIEIPKGSWQGDNIPIKEVNAINLVWA